MPQKQASKKKRPAKLKILNPLIGSWKAESDSPMGPVSCTRTFSSVLNGSCIQLHAEWKFGNRVYEELAIYTMRDGVPVFWSFTSDGKRSEGALADGSDVHPDAICFEAEMPAGRARMIYWPDEKDGLHWAVEAKNAKGWRRFTEHHYRRI